MIFKFLHLSDLAHYWTNMAPLHQIYVTELSYLEPKWVRLDQIMGQMTDFFRFNFSTFRLWFEEIWTEKSQKCYISGQSDLLMTRLCQPCPVVAGQWVWRICCPNDVTNSTTIDSNLGCQIWLPNVPDCHQIWQI